MENETQLFQYKPEDKAQSEQQLPRGGSDLVTAEAHCSGAKVMAAVSEDAQSIFFVEFLEDQRMIASADWLVKVT